jgi:hypothetical protein
VLGLGMIALGVLGRNAARSSRTATGPSYG